MLLQAPEQLKSPGDCVFSKDQREYGPYIHRRFGGCLISRRALALTQVLTRAPTTFLHPSQGNPTPLSDSWTSMQESLTSEWKPGEHFLAAPNSTKRVQFCFFLHLLLFLLPLLLRWTWSSNWLICKWTYGSAARWISCCRAWHNLNENQGGPTFVSAI